MGNNKTGIKYKTVKCGRCGQPHSGYSGKLDANGVEYVICGSTGKRMNVSEFDFFSTIWKIENG